MHILTLDPHVNPAIAFYEAWQAALEAMHGPLTLTQNAAMYYGRIGHMGIGQMLIPDPQPGAKATTAHAGLGFGYTSGYGGRVSSFSPVFVVSPSGEFRFLHAPTGGWKQRDRVTANTFLSWRRFAGQTSWHVSQELEGSYYRHDYSAPVNYVNDRTLGLGNAYGNYGGSAWLRLEEVDSAWTIQFSRQAVNQGYPTDEAAFRKMDMLRDRRYRSWEREHQIRMGLINPSAPRTRLTPDEQQERFEKAAEALTGRLVVTRRPTNLMKKETA